MPYKSRETGEYCAIRFHVRFENGNVGNAYQMATGDEILIKTYEEFDEEFEWEEQKEPNWVRQVVKDQALAIAGLPGSRNREKVEKFCERYGSQPNKKQSPFAFIWNNKDRKPPNKQDDTDLSTPNCG